MVGVIEGFRWCLLGENSPFVYSWLSFGMLSILFITGLIYFKKVESTMADII
jgi:lipopolysaccharide transport system permease protein